MVRILLVEDERIIARDIRLSLENLGYTVAAIASSGEEAIAKAAELQPDLILMDIRLETEMDGIQAAAHIWRDFQIPFIYATGYSDRSTLERAKVTNPFGYILKPIEERELYVAVETALQRFQLSIELQRREEWLTAILRGMGDGVIVVNADAQVTFLNSVAEQLLSTSQEAVYNHPISDVFQIVHEETLAPVENPVMAALNQGEIKALPDHTLLIAGNGRMIPIADSAAPLRDEHYTITGAVLVFRDITEKRQAEERSAALALNQQLQNQMAEMQRLNQLKDDFLSTVSHELRTPLANIKMAVRMLEVILNQPTQHPSHQKERTDRYLQILQDQCDRELNLVNDLLDFQKLSGDTYNIQLTTVPLAEWIHQLTEGFQARLHNRQLTLHTQLAPDLPAIAVDIVALDRMVTELLNNACKYSPPGEQIVITIAPVESQIQLDICNTGVEIAPDEFDRIFEPFYRIPQSDRWRQGGTGLGLSLVKKLATVLGGSIQVESTPNQTCFTLRLPLQPQETSPS
ncbi:response regulator [Oscillatoria sp. FACHB-1407]|uniref:hybrid sensor histidine kinase/response regulator n=1 Tax=Oscillatoria sp. FACHB-1407 TaxID=2692847 RepID=UPI0016833D71|nr:ATP-binding protein [Oscillatoria sp. FACHB-1407]MBD2465061.1 response regulator [Oscillatoria sp. FACHB-1407]